VLVAVLASTADASVATEAECALDVVVAVGVEVET
jgi:hypothetical protein